MTKFLLDTNILSYLEDQTSPYHNAVIGKVSSIAEESEILVSILSFYELQYSFSCADDELRENILKSIATIQEVFTIIPLCFKGAEAYGKLKKKYKDKIEISKKNLERHNADFMIASTAISENAVLVSNDNIFTHINSFHKNFQLENWTL